MRRAARPVDAIGLLDGNTERAPCSPIVARMTDAGEDAKDSVCALVQPKKATAATTHINLRGISSADFGYA